MNFDPRDLIDANLPLIRETAALLEPGKAVIMTIATWGRGADPALLRSLQPFRHGLGYNGSIVAGVPVSEAQQWLPPEAWEQCRKTEGQPIYSAVYKDWVVETL